MRVANLIVAGSAVLALPGSAAGASARSSGRPPSSDTPPSTQPPAGTGGAGFTPGPPPVSTPQHPVIQGFVAKVIHGLAYAPSDAPIAVQRAIWAGDQIRHKPYLYAGGHAVWNDVGYDCSGSVSYVLHAAGQIQTSMDSSQMMSWGEQGAGQWITVYANPGHAFVEIAGIRFDTSSEEDPHPAPGTGPHWRALMTSTVGYDVRHPLGF